MATQTYNTSPGRKTMTASSAPTHRGLIAKEMANPTPMMKRPMSKKGMTMMAKPSTVKKIAKKRARKAKK